MKKKFVITLLLFIALFTFDGCTTKDNTQNNEPLFKNGEVIGTGEKQFTLDIIDSQQNKTTLTINTDHEMVGEALQELNVIEGEDSKFGLFIKSVNGITADFNESKTYWAFYINNEYAITGIDTTPIEEDTLYCLKVEK